jgi:hypothetical protein
LSENLWLSEKQIEVFYVRNKAREIVELIGKSADALAEMTGFSHPALRQCTS